MFDERYSDQKSAFHIAVKGKKFYYNTILSEIILVVVYV